MTRTGSADAAFSGSIPQLYDRCLGPLLFQPFARIAADRIAELSPARILETAAGTGIVTAAVAEAVPKAQITATDLNQAMLDVLAGRCVSDTVTACVADAQDLPFDDGQFDLVLCQFGSMFYPDRVKANAEARRVLRDGGTYLQVIWDELARNPVSQRVEEAVAIEFAADPPRFLSRTPFGYFDRERIEQDLRGGGFSDIRIDRLETASRVSARDAAIGMCQGSPLRSEIEARDPNGLDRATDAAAEALQPLDGRDVTMSALFVAATR